MLYAVSMVKKRVTKRMFAHKQCGIHRDDGRVICGFADVKPHPQMVKYYGSGEIHEVEVSVADMRSDTPYWGWLDFEDDEFQFIYPSRHGTEMCFPYGSKVMEEKGEGKMTKLNIKAVEGA